LVPAIDATPKAIGAGRILPRGAAEDRTGAPHDFSDSALLAGAPHTDFIGQGQFDAILGTSHLGILNSPDVWSAAFQFLDH
jgi:hypothetical protein